MQAGYTLSVFRDTQDDFTQYSAKSGQIPIANLAGNGRVGDLGDWNGFTLPQSVRCGD
jgi:hypothetical protein